MCSMDGMVGVWKGREAEDLRGKGAFFVEELEEEWRRCLAINFAGCGGHSEREIWIWFRPWQMKCGVQ